MDALRDLFKALPYLGFFAAAVLAWYFYVKARNRERMALIEKGVDLSKFYSMEKRWTFPWLSIGIIISGIVIGILLVVGLVFLFPENDMLIDLAQPGIILFGVWFGGLSMILVHYINKRRKE
jgi:hypothetical protein